MIQVVFLPLDNKLNPRKDLPVFDIRLRPNFIERIEPESLRISQHQLMHVIDTGIDQERGVEMFENWVSKLNLPINKKILPLGHNVTLFDLPFIREWLGQKMFDQYIYASPRDTLIVANFLNDMADFKAEGTPFPKLGLSNLCARLDIEVFEQGTHDALYDAYLAAEVYKKLLTHHLLEVL
jgi:hypothetical protein